MFLNPREWDSAKHGVNIDGRLELVCSLYTYICGIAWIGALSLHFPSSFVAHNVHIAAILCEMCAQWTTVVMNYSQKKKNLSKSLEISLHSSEFQPDKKARDVKNAYPSHSLHWIICQFQFSDLQKMCPSICQRDCGTLMNGQSQGFSE